VREGIRRITAVHAWYPLERPDAYSYLPASDRSVRTGVEMRQFEDQDGRRWTARVGERPGNDYKGRYFLVMEADDAAGDPVSLVDVRWNSPRAAERALETMSLVELRRRLRSATGRITAPTPSV
jgi:hypothetical protein